MPIKHKIKVNFKGTIKEVSLNPDSAIKWQCAECMGFAKNGSEDCTSDLCPIYPFRPCIKNKPTRIIHKIRYKEPDGTIKTKAFSLTKLKSIRKFCLECVGWEQKEKELTNCQHICSLWPFRMGKNPAMKNRVGNTKGLEAKRRSVT